MPQLFILALGLLAQIQVSLCGVTTVEEFAVLEGRSITVPCHYEPQYAGYVKYWCRGRTREFCSILAQTDHPRSPNVAEEKVSIFDDPVQLVFTVTMTELKEEDSGWYSCGVEIGGMWSADITAFTHVRVIHERARRRWCRSRDWSSCLQTSSDGSYQDAAVAIRDDRTGTFAVTLKAVQMRDTGWYWCTAGQQQVAVHVLVTPRPSTTAAATVTSSPTPSQPVAYLPPPKPITKESWGSHKYCRFQ
ncbi:hypothetical protein LDENG_00241490 [Lucifuga dentata]|nr:hypothetical protein LDENG_00241490 [Lucifuga dentata]